MLQSSPTLNNHFPPDILHRISRKSNKLKMKIVIIALSPKLVFLC